eukprot:3401340-Rhodomonas_salina.2
MVLVKGVVPSTDTAVVARHYQHGPRPVPYAAMPYPNMGQPHPNMGQPHPNMGQPPPPMPQMMAHPQNPYPPQPYPPQPMPGMDPGQGSGGFVDSAIVGAGARLMPPQVPGRSSPGLCVGTSL